MQIQSVKIIPYQLGLKQLWQTNQNSLDKRNGWLVKITTDSGLSGYGDSAPLHSAGTEQTDKTFKQLKKYRAILQKTTVSDALNKLNTTEKTPAARCGVETALLDLSSQVEQKTLRHWLNPRAKNTVTTNSVLGTLDNTSIQRVQQSISQGFHTVKLKVGVNKLEDEIRYLENLCIQLPATVKLRLDANTAWNFQQATTFISAVKHLPIESIEEPIQNPDLLSLSKLQEKSPIPLALDESMSLFKLDEIVKHQVLKRLIIKPMVHGGLLPSLVIARQAALHDVETVVTSIIESAIGLQATAQLAAAIPIFDDMKAHGLATSEWLTNDLAQSPLIMNGNLQLPNTPGLGLSPKKG